MSQPDFETVSRRDTSTARPRWSNGLSRYRVQILASLFVVVALLGGAYYSSRVSEAVPKVVYSASLDEAIAEANRPLQVDINAAGVEELDELPQVGPSTAEKIIEHREYNGPFRSVDELEEVPGIGPKTLEEIRPFATV